MRPPGRAVVVVVAAYSLVRYYSRVCHLASVRGLNIPHPRWGAHAGHDHWRKQHNEMGQEHLSLCSFGDIKTI